MRVSVINAGVVILGIMMLGAGVQAMRSPSLGVLLTQTIMATLLFLWNLGVSVLNLFLIGIFNPFQLIFPLALVIMFAT
jgi:hypothetical protein